MLRAEKINRAKENSTTEISQPNSVLEITEVTYHDHGDDIVRVIY